MRHKKSVKSDSYLTAQKAGDQKSPAIMNRLHYGIKLFNFSLSICFFQSFLQHHLYPPSFRAAGADSTKSLVFQARRRHVLLWLLLLYLPPIAFRITSKFSFLFSGFCWISQLTTAATGDAIFLPSQDQFNNVITDISATAFKISSLEIDITSVPKIRKSLYVNKAAKKWLLSSFFLIASKPGIANQFACKASFIIAIRRAIASS